MLDFYRGQSYSAFASEKIAVSGVSIGFTATKYRPASVEDGTAADNPALVAVVTIFDAPIRFTIDGSVPAGGAGSNGHVWATGNDPIVVRGLDNIRRFRMVRNTTTDAEAFVTFLR